MLRQIMYRSRSLIGGWGPELIDIARQGLRRNEAAGISSTLYHDESLFCQVLEGPSEALQPLLVRLEADPRHFNMRIIVDAPIPGRSDDAVGMRFIDGRHAVIARKMVHGAVDAPADGAMSLLRALVA
ncbi:MAG: BLUF domain-containing protein [Pseudomonadota bacterium]